MNIELKILQNCSGKTLKELFEIYGEQNVKELLNKNYIVVDKNNKILKTELGINASKMITSPTNENFGKNGFQLLTDNQKHIDGKLLLS